MLNRKVMGFFCRTLPLLLYLTIVFASIQILVHAENGMTCKPKHIPYNVYLSAPKECDISTSESNHAILSSLLRVMNRETCRKKNENEYRSLSLTDKHPKRIELKQNKDMYENTQKNNNSEKTTSSKTSKLKKKIKHAIYTEKIKNMEAIETKMDVMKVVMDLDIKTDMKKIFPTTYYRWDGTDDTTSPLNKYLDIIEKAVNQAAQTMSLNVIKNALSFYEILQLVSHPPSRLFIQKADTLTLLHHIGQNGGSYKNLRLAIDTYRKVLHTKNVSDFYFKVATLKIVKLLKSRGKIKDAIIYQKFLLSRFPNTTEFIDNLGYLYSTVNDILRAIRTFEISLAINPNNQFGLAMLGNLYIIRATHSSDQNSKQEEMCNILLKSGVSLLQKVLENRNVRILDRQVQVETVLQLVGALRKLGRYYEADEVYELASYLSVFPRFWQRSYRNCKEIRTKPVWTIHETKMSKFLKKISRKWKQIREKALYTIERNLFHIENENIHDAGKWSQFVIFTKGQLVQRNCFYVKILCRPIGDLLQSSRKRLKEVYFSLMESGTHLRPHSGPSNFRIRAHLGIDVDSGDLNSAGTSFSRLRVVNEYLYWKNGKYIFFDDSFDHEVWHFDSRNRSRLVLIIDMWHPDLTGRQIASLESSFPDLT